CRSMEVSVPCYTFICDEPVIGENCGDGDGDGDGDGRIRSSHHTAPVPLHGHGHRRGLRQSGAGRDDQRRPAVRGCSAGRYREGDIGGDEPSGRPLIARSPADSPRTVAGGRRGGWWTTYAPTGTPTSRAPGRTPCGRPARWSTAARSTSWSVTSTGCCASST